MQVGGMLSKFGEPLAHAERIISVLRDADQMIGLHVHSSSQNLRTDETVQAIKRVYELAISIGWDRIAYFDLGGGYPVNYGFTPVAHIEAYANKLRKALPLLFDGSTPVITEFGRYYHANAGWTISQIADIKRFNQHQTILQHAGADLFLRECYEAGKWPHRFFLHPQNIDQGEDWNTDIGGPLCFGGDYIAKGIQLPEARKNDWLVMLDTGANSYALWSKHCSRPFPKVIGYLGNEMFVIKSKQTSEEAIALWS
jgi:diaminopimelate decarboxylase